MLAGWSKNEEKKLFAQLRIAALGERLSNLVQKVTTAIFKKKIKLNKSAPKCCTKEKNIFFYTWFFTPKIIRDVYVLMFILNRETFCFS